MKKSIADIKKEYRCAITEEQKQAFLFEYRADERKGVLQLVNAVKKQQQLLEKERQRLEQLKVFERKYSTQYSMICGVDEAGRGPLAGPVVAGACILPPEEEILYLNDSKKLSAKKREELYEQITQKAIAWGVGIVSAERIDEINILQATYEAMQKAIAALGKMPDCLLVDAVHIPKVTMKQVGIIKGDAKSVSIAAASILAKVTRDRIMEQYDEAYPQYGFRNNKGYGAAQHIEALKNCGPCPIHRKTFIKNFVTAEEAYGSKEANEY